MISCVDRGGEGAFNGYFFEREFRQNPRNHQQAETHRKNQIQQVASRENRSHSDRENEDDKSRAFPGNLQGPVACLDRKDRLWEGRKFFGMSRHFSAFFIELRQTGISMASRILEMMAAVSLVLRLGWLWCDFGMTRWANTGTASSLMSSGMQ